jgi:RimJ/RimL family protein N-acetyltransferase
MPGRDRGDFSRVRPALEGALVRLRAFDEHDIPAVSSLFNDPDVLYHLDQVVFPQPVEGTREWWESTRRSNGQQLFVIETLDGDLVGACDLRDISDRSRAASLGIWIGQPYWDRGYGTDAVRTLCRFGFHEMNLQRIELHVHETNERGRRAYERVGFKEEGRLRRAHFIDGRYVDTLVMGLLSDELIEE